MSQDETDNQEKSPGRPLILKFEFHGERYELGSLTLADTVGHLRAVLCSMINIDDFDRVHLKTLQPTKIIDRSDDQKLLSEIFKQSRERIVVEDATNHQQEQIERSLSHVSSEPGMKHHKSESQDQGWHSRIVDDTGLVNSENLPSSRVPTSSQSGTMSALTESPRQRKIPREQNDYPVCSSTGYLLRHPVPSNNSCLFISVHYCLTDGSVDDQIGKSMRRIIADTVASDKEHFDDALLGKSNSEYCKWILDDNNWGGAIELSILCKYFKTEIVVIDIKNTILNRFGEDSHYDQRMLLLYDGLHYDPIKFQPLDDNLQIQTLFSTENIEVLKLAEELAKEAKQSHQFTDVSNLVMRCAACNAELDSKTAPEHAARTGHVEFVQENSDL